MLYRSWPLLREKILKTSLQNNRDNWGYIANAPPESSRGSFSGRQVADVNLDDKNAGDVKFLKQARERQILTVC